MNGAFWNSFGEWLGARLLPVSLELAVLALVVTAALHIFRIRKPSHRHLFWCLVLLKPLLALCIAAPITLYGLLPAVYIGQTSKNPAVVSTGISSIPGATINSPNQAADSASIASTAKTAVLTDISTATATVKPVAQPHRSGQYVRWNIFGLAGLAWSLIAALLGLRLIAGLFRLNGLVRRSAELKQEPVADLAREIAGEMGFRRHIRLALSNEVSGPMLIGCLRPWILLPQGLPEVLTDEQMRLAVAHELSHVRRLDNLFLWLQRINEVVFFFHPVVWFCGSMLRREAEEACDALVVQKLAEPAIYADSLLRVADHSMKRNMGGMEMLANTFTAKESLLKRRIKSILRQKAYGKPMVIAGLFLLALAVTGLPSFSGRTAAAAGDGSFAIYLVDAKKLGLKLTKDGAPDPRYSLAETSATFKAMRMNLDKLPLERQPLLKAGDIMTYTMPTHEFGTKRDLIWCQKIPDWGKPFVAVAGGKRIYLGALWNNPPVKRPPVPALYMNGFNLKTYNYCIAPPTTGADKRGDPAIMQALGSRKQTIHEYDGKWQPMDTEPVSSNAGIDATPIYAGSPGFSAEVKEGSDIGKTSYGRVFVDGRKIRIEYTNSEGSIWAQIYRYDQGVVRLLNPEYKTYSEQSLSIFSSLIIDGIEKLQTKAPKLENIGAYPCEIRSPEKSETTIWYSDRLNFPLKVRKEYLQKQNATTSIVRYNELVLQNIKEGKQAGSLFEIPADYRLTSFFNTRGATRSLTGDYNGDGRPDRAEICSKNMDIEYGLVADLSNQGTTNRLVLEYLPQMNEKCALALVKKGAKIHDEENGKDITCPLDAIMVLAAGKPSEVFLFSQGKFRRIIVEK